MRGRGERAGDPGLYCDALGNDEDHEEEGEVEGVEGGGEHDLGVL